MGTAANQVPSPVSGAGLRTVDGSCNNLFPGRDTSQPMYPTTITHKVAKLGRALGVRIHPHALRHYCATQSLGAGVPLPIVAARLGDTVGTVTKVYAHALRADDRGAADALARTIL